MSNLFELVIYKIININESTFDEVCESNVKVSILLAKK